MSGVRPIATELVRRGGPPLRGHFRTHAPQKDRSDGQPFSSRLSSLRKRQFVPSAIILPGANLIMPASRSRSE
jgi:hypothetical protein